MTLGSELAVVVRSRGGKNLLVQTRGFDAKLIAQVCQEVASSLEAAAQAADPSDLVSTLQGQPLMCGHVRVLGGRVTVAYRIINQVLVLVIAPSTASLCSSYDILAHVVRVLLTEGKVLELTPDKLEKKYAEIYFAVSAIVCSGGMVGGTEALAASHATLESLQSKDLKKTKHKSIHSSAPQYKKKRTLAGQAAQITRLSFQTAEAFKNVKPVPGFELKDPPGARVPSLFNNSLTVHEPDGLQSIPSAQPKAAPPKPASNDPFAASTAFTDEDIFSLLLESKKAQDNQASQTKQTASKPEAAFDVDFLNDQPAKPAAKDTAQAVGEDWAAFGTSTDKAADDAFGDSAFGPLPSLTQPVLQLQETWQCEVVGGRLVSAGLTGFVRWASEDLRKQQPRVDFALQLPDFAGEDLTDVLHLAESHPSAVRTGPTTGSFTASSSAVTADASLLQYCVPLMSYPVPVQLQLVSSIQRVSGYQLAVHIALRYNLSPDAGIIPQVLEANIVFPAMFELPVRVHPVGATVDAKERKLQWLVKDPVPGQCRQLVAVFVVSADELACQSALKRVQAQLLVKGQPGSTLTGVGLAQGTKDLQEHLEAMCWQAVVSAKLAL